jgi:predicted O-methyltransferase YrrM
MNARSLARTIVTPLRTLEARAHDALIRLLVRPLQAAFQVPSHLTSRERFELYRLARGRDVVCEIGSYVGASACCFGAAMHERGDGMILCIDTWRNDAMTEGARDTHAEFSRNTASYARYITQIRGFSTEVVDQVARRAQRIDLLFIDGDHSYEGAKADWDAYKGFLRAGSVVVFHDCGWAEGVQRVIEEDAKPCVSSYERLPNMWWGVLKS